jgi:hypothetical protein
MKDLRRFVYSVTVFVFLSLSSWGQPKYDVTLINPDLVKYAKAVVRTGETKLSVSSLTSATLEVKQAITILNERGRDLSVYVGIDDKFVTYRFGNLIIYDKNGKKVKSFGTLALEPMITFSGSTLYNDVKLKTIDPEYRTYPFTVEVSYNVDLKGFFSFPDWVIAKDYSISTERSVLSVKVPDNFELRYFEQNMPANGTIKKEGVSVIYEWKVENFKAIKEEPFSMPAERLSPAVFLAPAKFEMAGKKGSTSTWQEFGQFFADLNHNRNILPESIVSKIKEIAASTTDTTWIIRKLYSMMQEKTRYVNVQIGIGGWQPIEAMKVHETSYGDCKALSNYMKSMLDAAGIEACYAIVRAGDDDVYLNSEFPSNQFNHVIVCVPGGKDTIWLECTSQRIPFNYIGTFTDDRYALLITEDGGRLAHTRRYSSENLRSRKTSVVLEPSGNSRATVTTYYSHSFYDDMLPVLLSDYENQKRLLTGLISVPDFKLIEFMINQPDKTLPVIREDLELSIKGNATVMGDRMILPFNLLNKSSMLPVFNERNSEIMILRDKTTIDTIIYKIPTGYVLSSTFNPINLNSEFGSCETFLHSTAEHLIFVRKQTIKKGIFSSTKYPEFTEFSNKIASADMVKVVLQKQ